jgi:hypothetical protein
MSMSLIEMNAVSVDQLAESLFDEMVIPSAKAIRASNCRGYFPTSRDAGATTYFEAPILTVMQSSDFDFPGAGDAEGLIAAAKVYWMAQGEDHLEAVAPKLITIARALREEAGDSSGDVDILCYTMF